MQFFYFGYIGKQGSGKDTVCDIMKNTWKGTIKKPVYHYRMAFADPLKADIRTKLGVDTSCKTPLVRQLLQTYGVLMREQQGAHYWQQRTAAKLFSFIDKIKARGTFADKETFVFHFPDVRFEEEYLWLKSMENSFIIKVEADREHRQERVANRSIGESLSGEDHPSETFQDCLIPDITLNNNSTIVNLSQELASFIKVVTKHKGHDVCSFTNNKKHDSNRAG